MRIALCSLLASVLGLGACNFGGGEGDDYYTEPGGGGGSYGQSGGLIPDARMGDAGAAIDGQICGLVDYRDWDDCTMSGYDGYLVELGTSQGSANDGGMFSMPTPGGTNLVWKVYDVVVGTPARTTYAPFSPSTVVFTHRQADYEDLAQNNGAAPISGGAVFVRVRKANVPVVDATATITPASASLTLYDDVSAATWGVTNTGELGVIWFPNVPASAAATVTITPAGPSAVPYTLTLPVVNQATTFVTAEIP